VFVPTRDGVPGPLELALYVRNGFVERVHGKPKDHGRNDENRRRLATLGSRPDLSRKLFENCLIRLFSDASALVLALSEFSRAYHS